VGKAVTSFGECNDGPASTLIFIKALAMPAFRVEIEALAVGDA